MFETPINSIINVPMEHVYLYEYDDEDNDDDKISQVRRDKAKRNRFWFAFPSEWRTSTQSERIIGVRSLWISKVYRHLSFHFEINKETVKEPRKTTRLGFDVHSWWDYEKDLRELWLDFRSYFAKSIELNKSTWEQAGTPVITIQDFHMDYSFEKYQGRTSYSQKFYCPNMEEEYITTFSVSDFNDDAKYTLNVPNDYKPEFVYKYIFYDVWDRHSVLLQSSIATNTHRNYLGFSGIRYSPIKYFKLNAGDTEFWIDMYQGHNHHIPTMLPMDNKEGIVLEIVLLHNANKLY